MSAVLPFDINGAWIGNIGHDLFLDEVGAAPDRRPGHCPARSISWSRPTASRSSPANWQTAICDENQLTGDRAAHSTTRSHRLQAAFDAAEDGEAVRRRLDGKAVSVLMRSVPETGWQYYVATPLSSMIGGASRALLLFSVTAVGRDRAGGDRHAHADAASDRRADARLADTVRSFAAGDPQLRAKIDRDDDIGDLGRAFNAMADQISAAHDDLTLTQEELQHRNTALVHANRTKSNFLANMSHELRTPLNAIIGFAEILRHQMFGPLGNERYASYVDDIQRSGQHLLSLINDILDMSRIEAGRQPMKLEQQPLRPLIERSMRMAQPMAENRGVRLTSTPTASISAPIATAAR